MSKLLFNLHNVPDDEADDVRQLLQTHNIEFHETQAGRWRSGVAALWLNDAEQFPQARALLDQYQRERAINARAAYEESCARGEQQGFWRRAAAQPLQYAIVTIAVAAIVALLTLPLIGGYLNH